MIFLAHVTPHAVLYKYRNPANLEEFERYPNVDWQDELFKKHAMAYNGNVSISGGTKFVRYFAVIDFVHEGDPPLRPYLFRPEQLAEPADMGRCI